MPGRRKRGNRKRSAPARAPRASPRRLLDQAREPLAGGDGRKALDLIRQARDRDDSLAGLPLLSFCASMQRARQLAAKGMDREAATMRARADGYRASMSLPALSEDEWIQYVRYLDGGDALAAYADHLDGGRSLPRVERVLADRLVVQRFWVALDVFDETHPLRRDAAAVRSGLDAMDAGDWARAANLLQGVPRRSPFAAWRLFCRAMVCFGAGDDDGLRRILDRLPDDFALARTVAEWRRLVGRDAAGNGRPVAPKDGNGRLAALAGELQRALHNGNVRAAGTAIERLAGVLYPEDPARARIDLLEIAGLATLRDLLPGGVIERLSRRLLPADRVIGVAARILLARQQVVPAAWNPVPAVALVDVLAVEFPREQDRALARACVLEALARTGRAAMHPDFLPPEMGPDLTALLGRPVEDPGMVFVELMLASLEADPDNRDGYLFLLDLLRGQNAGKQRVKRVLQDMADRFPDDSTPWLELASLHYARNAYRQAEGALEEARRRAPHDDRLLDLQAVGFLKSAEQSRRKGRFALAVRDLERAEKLGRRVIESVLPAKWLLLEVVSGDADTSATVARHLEGLPPGAQLRMLALLLRDLYDNHDVRNVRPEMAEAVWRLLADGVSLASECASEEIVRVLEPLPAALDLLYDDRRVAATFTRWWPALLERVDGERLPAVLDVLMDCDGQHEVRVEIERRLRGVRKPRRDPLLLFYLVVIRYEEGSDHDARRFRDVLKKVDAPTRERLRSVAARLARHGEVDPDLCVALGAGVQAGLEMGQDTQAVLVDITPYTFGTRVEGELYGRPYAHEFMPLIRRNSKLPAIRTDVFFTLFEDQEEAEIKVYQGEDPDALKNVEIGTFLFGGLNQREGARDRGLLVTYSLDLDGLLHVHARERATGREIRGVFENAIGRAGAEALGEARERVSALWRDGGEADAQDAGAAAAGGGAAPSPPVAVPPDVAGEVEATLARAEQALEAAPAEDREEMIDLMEDLRDALKEGAAERAGELRRELDEILFYLE